MDKIVNPNICPKHSLEYVAISLAPQCDLEKRKECLRCLSTKLEQCDMKLIKDAEEQMTEFKDAFMQQKIDQGTSNINILQKLMENIQNFKEQMNQLLDKTLIVIQQNIQQITSELNQIQEKLQTIELDTYINKDNEFNQKESIYNQIQNIIEEQLKNINGQLLLDECYVLTKSIDKRLIVLMPYQIPKNYQIIEQRKTPSLAIDCAIHQKEIILFDMNQNTSKENRIACIDCCEEKLGLKNLQTIQTCWQAYEQNLESIFKRKQQSKQQKINTIKQSLQNLKDYHEKKINEFCISIDNFKINDELNAEKTRLNIGKDWQHLDKEEILEIAEILGNQQYKQHLEDTRENDDNKQEDILNIMTRDCILNLKQHQEQCINKIQQLIDQDQLINQTKTIQQDINISIISIDYSLQTQYRGLQFNNSIGDSFYYQRKKLSIHHQFISIPYKLIQIKPVSHNPANYQLESSQDQIAQTEYCFAIAFNKDQNIMVAGCNNKIKVFSFKDGKLKEIQIIYEHTGVIAGLQFMKKQNQFISIGHDNSIILWGMIGNQQFQFQQVFKGGHTSYVYCILINSNDDLIISGSGDTTIRFWNKKTEWECFQSLQAHSGSLSCISLSESQKQLISSGDDKQIIISQTKDNRKWEVMQKIQGFGYKVCFIEDNLFIFQPYSGDKMQVYQFNQQNQQYIKINDIAVENQNGENYYFPSIFKKENQLFLHRYNNRVYFMKRKNRVEFFIEQTIQFANCNFGAAITDDFQYLVIHDGNSGKFQIRKQKQ